VINHRIGCDELNKDHADSCFLQQCFEKVYLHSQNRISQLRIVNPLMREIHYFVV